MIKIKIKRLLGIILLLFTIVNTNIFAALYTSRTTDYDFKINNDGRDTITLSEYKGRGVINYLPEEVHEMVYSEELHKEVVGKVYYPTRISSSIFPDKSKIRDRVFIPDNYIEIEQAAFKDAIQFRNAIIGKGITQIPDECFEGDASLENYTGGINVTSIGRLAFSECKKLTKVELSEKITEIGNKAFYGCIELENLTFPDSLKTIGSEAFFGCTKLITKLPSNIETIGDKAFSNTKLKDTLVFPNSLKEVGSRAFLNTDVEYVKIMKSDLPRIEQDTFLPSVKFILPLGSKKNNAHIEKGYGNYETYEVIYGDASDDGFVNSTDSAIVLDIFKNDTPPEDIIEFMKIDLDSNDLINGVDSAIILDIFKNS